MKTKPSPAPVTLTKYENGKPVASEVLNPTMKDTAMNPKTETATPDEAAKPATVEKTPAESKLVRDATYEFGEKAIDDDVKHHQAKIIVELITAGKTTLKAIHDAIASDQELTKRMNTKQPIERCVRYHSKWLADRKYLKVTKAEQPKKEKAEPKEKSAKPAKTEAPSKLANV